MANIYPQRNKKTPEIVLTAIKEKHTKDLTKLTLIELLDVKRREEDILEKQNKLLKILPDKGQRVIKFHEKVLAEVRRREDVDAAADILSQLNIASKAEKTLNQLEWNGKLIDENLSEAADQLNDVLDSDDEADTDPLYIIAQRTMHERRTKILRPQPSLITAEDIEEIKTFAANSTERNVASFVNAEIVNIDVGQKLDKIKSKLKLSTEIQTDNDDQTTIEQHVLFLVDKTETNANIVTREKFKPYRTTISNVHDPSKEQLRKKGKYWEITAATPPPLQHSGTKLLTLLDSVELQKQYSSKMKELQEKQASERLSAKMNRMQSRKLELSDIEKLRSKASFQNYRVSNIEGHHVYNELDEIHDPLDEEKSPVVNYNVHE